MKLDLYQRPEWAAVLLLDDYIYTYGYPSLRRPSAEEQRELAQLVTKTGNAKLALECAWRSQASKSVRKTLVSFAVEHAEEEVSRELLTNEDCYKVLTFDQKQQLFRRIVRSDKIVHHIEMLFCHGKHISDVEKAAFIRGLLRRNSRKLACDALDCREIYVWLSPLSAHDGWKILRTHPPKWLPLRHKLLKAFVPVIGDDPRLRIPW